MMSTPVHVESADQQAYTAILGHHAELRRELGDRVAALREAVGTGGAHQDRLAAVRTFVDGDVLPHAAAEEVTLYPAAAEAAPLLVEAMRVEHRALIDRAQALGTADAPVEALAAAEGLAAVFAVHVDKENDLFVPLLTRTPGVSLAALVRAMHDHMDAPAEAADASGEAPEELDVRRLPHGGGRHEAIFGRLDGLSIGDRLVIVNDHDPRPLRFQLDAAWPGVFAWEYVESGPRVWRVAITREA